MTELLLWRWDHATQSVPTPSVEQLARLPQRFDLISAQPDGWHWGTVELTDPRYRIITWPLLDFATASQFLSPLLARLDINLKPVTYPLYRAFFLNLSSVALPAAVRNWWTDDTRVVQKLGVNLVVATTITAVKTARLEVLIG